MYETSKTLKEVSPLLYRKIMDTAKDEANKYMNIWGRKSWDEDDHDLFTKTFFALLKTHAGYDIKDHD